MPNETSHRVEVITGIAGRPCWLAHETLRIIEASLVPGEPVSAVARRNGVAPNLLFRWRRLMDEGGAMTAGPYEPVVGASEVRELDDKVHALKRMLGRKMMETEPQVRAKRRDPARGAGEGGSKKTDVASAVAADGRFPVSRVAEVLEVSRSQLHGRVSGASKFCGAYSRAADAELLPAICRLVDQRPTYGYRRLTALLNRKRRASGLEPVNRKRVLRILGQHGLTLERATGRREGRVHDGRVAVMASNLRWCSDALEIGCRNGERVRIALAIVLGPMADEARSSTPSMERSSTMSPWRAPVSPALTSGT